MTLIVGKDQQGTQEVYTVEISMVDNHAAPKAYEAVGA
jgi:hypothetical protein